MNFLLNKTPLYFAVEKGNIEIIKLLLQNNEIDVNILNIFISFFNKIKNQNLNTI